jgi:hypothetical protein
MPVARKVWQQVEEGRPVAVARRLIIRNYIRARYRIRRESPVYVHTAEQWAFLFLPDSRNIQVRINVCFSVVVRRYLVALAAFFVEANPPALALLIIIICLHMDDRTHPREGRRPHPSDGRPGLDRSVGLRRISLGKDEKIPYREDRRMPMKNKDDFRSACGSRFLD